MIRRICVVLLATCMVAVITRGLIAADFLRGDANSDGTLSLADAQFTFSHLFRQGPEFECESAANANSDSKVNVADGIWIFNYLFLNGPAPSAPFPAAGPAPEGDSLPCPSYGNGAPLDDPAAEIEALDAVAVGGANGAAVLKLAISSSRALGGYSVRLRKGVALGGVESEKDLSGTLDDGMLDVNDFSHRDAFSVSFLCTISGTGHIAAGAHQPVLEVGVCLRPGTRAGEYPLVLEGAELIDAESGRAIEPRVVPGTLTVLEDLAPSVGCGPDACGPLDPPADPSQLSATYALEGGSAYRGDEIAVAFKIRATQPLGGYAFSIDFDEATLRAASIEEIAQVRDDGFKRYELDNGTAAEGNGGIDEGFFVGAAVFSVSSACAALPADVDNEVLRLHLEVRANAAIGETELRFLDGAQASGTPVRNSVTVVSGSAVFPETASSFVFVGAKVNVLPGEPAFVRGDSNGDASVNISDASATLGFLFLGNGAVPCSDAADANDDGAIDIADPIATLQYLFLGGASLPAPFPQRGGDPTPDALGCKIPA